MIGKNKFKLVALLGISLCVLSLLVHLLLANNSTGNLPQFSINVDDFYAIGSNLRNKKLWGIVNAFENLQPYANPRSSYPVPNDQNGYIYAKIYGDFSMIRSSICDLVVVSRLLNATLVIPEVQESLRSKGIISTRFKSFSYIYNEEQFIAALSNDVIVVRSLPNNLKEYRRKNKHNKHATFSPHPSATPDYYISEVLPMLKESKVIGLVISNGGCLESILPPSMVEYQRLRCRVGFHALQFRPEIQAVGNQIVERLRASGRPYLAFHPGLLRENLAFHGCAELFQDIHNELIQYRRQQLIKRRIIREDLIVDSFDRKRNGSCPLMPEEVGLLLRALGYHSNTLIYVAGSEIFGGQRVLIPLRALYNNLVDRTSVCTIDELSSLLGPENPLPSYLPHPPPGKTDKELAAEWKNAGPRPRPLPPPPARPFYIYEKEGWYGWVAETDEEPDPLPMDLRMQAHRLIWDAVDFHVSIEADAFFPGFHNDGSGWPDFSSLVMGHRLYQTASGVTYRPNRRLLSGLFEEIRDHLYHPKRNWTIAVREHLNKSRGVDGFVAEAQMLKPRSFLSHPFPECGCRISKIPGASSFVKGKDGRLLYGSEDQCPDWMVRGLAKTTGVKYEGGGSEENDKLEDETYLEESSLDTDEGSKIDVSRPIEVDEEMDPDD